MRRLPSSIAILAAAGVLALSLPARAQPGGDAAAEAVFAQGLEKFDHGDYVAACPLLARAVELSTTEALGGMLTLAECYEHTDRPASAWALYKHVAARAVIAKQADRAETAKRAADRLEPTLPRVVFVNQGDAAPNLRVRHEKDTVPSDVWNVPFPVDPGSQVFTFEADGREPKTVTVDIPKGPSRTEVSAPKLFTLVAPSRKPKQVRMSPVSAQESSFGGLGIAGVVIGVAGLGGLGASLGVILDAKSKWDDAVADDCNGDATRCTDLAGLDDARAQGDIASALFGVGTAVAAVGIILVVVDFAWDPEKKGQEARLFISPTIGGASATWEF